MCRFKPVRARHVLRAEIRDTTIRAHRSSACQHDVLKELFSTHREMNKNDAFLLDGLGTLPPQGFLNIPAQDLSFLFLPCVLLFSTEYVFDLVAYTSASMENMFDQVRIIIS